MQIQRRRRFCCFFYRVVFVSLIRSRNNAPPTKEDIDGDNTDERSRDRVTGGGWFFYFRISQKETRSLLIIPASLSSVEYFMLSTIQRQMTCLCIVFVTFLFYMSPTHKTVFSWVGQILIDRTQSEKQRQIKYLKMIVLLGNERKMIPLRKLFALEITKSLIGNYELITCDFR